MSNVLDDLDTVVESPTVDVPEAAPEPEVKAPEAKAPETKPEPKQEQHTIPLAAHLEERKQYRAEIEAERKRASDLEARLAKLEKPTPPAPVEPEFIEDPKGYVDHKVKAALDKLNGVEETIKATGKTVEETTNEARFTRFMGDLQATENTFRQATPDYLDALAHLRQARASEIQLTYPDITQEQLIQAIKNEELGLAQQLMQRGRNPHEVAYQLAKARGYVSKTALPAIPEVPALKQLSPDQSLGTGAGSPNAGESVIPDGEEFELAMKQVFGRKRA